MKCRSLFALFVASITILAAAPSVYPAAVLEVYPTGLQADDATNVQSALNSVDSPGTVILKSTDASGNPLAFNFAAGTVIKLLRPDITLTGDGWDEALDEPKTKIVGGGGMHFFSNTVFGFSMVFAVNAPGVTISQIKLTTSALTGIYVSSARQQASDHPVHLERNDLSAGLYCVLANYSAAFPVRIDRNTLRGQAPVAGWWIGFTVQPISTSPFDEPVEPRNASGSVVHFPFEVTNNTMVKTPGSNAWQTLWVYGWSNNCTADPEIGCRIAGSVYQEVPADNGPVLISGNHITVASPGAAEAIVLGIPAGGLSRALVKGNTVSGEGGVALWASSYGHDNLIAGNDFSGIKAYVPVFITGADTTFSDNILGSPTIDGLPAVLLLSTRDSLAAPMPNPVENCVIMKNDYRLIGRDHAAVLLASEADLQSSTGVGNEVKNNLIFEAGLFPEDSGGARNMIQILTGLTNPATQLPYVHDNRIIGHPARGIHHPGIGQNVSLIMQRMMQGWDSEF